MKKYKCVIFDLDGTLVDSLQGILNAINKTFIEFGINTKRTYEEGKTYIGAGASIFAKRAMNGLNLSNSTQEKIAEKFLENYRETQKADAKLFPGIKELIVSLKKRGYKIAIATNKPQVLLEPLISSLFGDIKFDALLGSRKNVPPKPDPTIIFEIMEKLNLAKEDCLYVGDSEYDYLTATNAGIDCLIGKYGYGFYDKDWLKKANYVVNEVKDISLLLS